MSEERRKNYRYPVTPVDEFGVLHRRGRKWPVKVTEKSAGGFRVVGRTGVKLAIGYTAMLETEAACSMVRVIHLTPSNDGLQIGLELIHDPSALAKSTALRNLAGALQSALLVVVGAFAVAIVGVFFLTDQAELAARFDDWRQGIYAPQHANANAIAGRRAVDPQNLGRGFARPVGLTTERFRTELQLTVQQQVMIQNIVDETAAALRIASVQPTGRDQWSDSGAQIVRQSWLRIQNVLSREQLQRWEELSAQSRQPALEHQALSQ